MQNAQKHSPWLLGAISIAALLSLAACETQVVGGGSGANAASGGSGGSGGTGGTGGNGNGGSGTAGGNVGTSNAISMLYSELQSPPNPTGTTAASTTSSGGGPDSNTLYIAISDTPELCTDPFAAEPCGNHYRVSIGIPVALQKVGIIALNDMSIISNFSWAGLNNSPDSCAAGGGSFFDGELEITAIDSTHVQGILTNTSTSDFDANGTFDAPRCVF